MYKEIKCITVWIYSFVRNIPGIYYNRNQKSAKFMGFIMKCFWNAITNSLVDFLYCKKKEIEINKHLTYGHAIKIYV